MRVLRLVDVRRGRDHIVTTFTVDDLPFHTTVWYEGIDLDALAERYTAAFERICVHVALFQLNTAISLRPDVIELGRYAAYLTDELVALWSTVAKHVWAQWRYDHDCKHYTGPRFVDRTTPAMAPIEAPPGDVELLAMCGGGKDSLVALRLLERAHLAFATLAYSHSIYGPAEPQHALIERVASATGRARAEREWIFDDLLDAPIPRLRPELGSRYLLAAETPASVFAALPIALARGYRGIVVAHEASANAANLDWGDEQVNHQWGKGWDAERLLDRYIQSLVAGVRYFSILQPIHDEVIFELLSRDPQLAQLTHSCNTQKPWCGACAKCTYVWLQFAAHLPHDVVAATFGSDLGERASNEHWFRELLGLVGHTPFECVGSVPEARLAFALARRRGALGPRLSALAAELGDVDVTRIATPLVAVGEQHGMPPHVAERIMPELRAAAVAAAHRLGVG